MKYLLIVVLALALSGFRFFGPSDAELQRATSACEEYVLEKAASKYSDETHVFDSWSKKGKIVVEVGYRKKDRWRRDGDSYNVRICVYDEKGGRIMLPSLLNMNDWRK